MENLRGNHSKPLTSISPNQASLGSSVGLMTLPWNHSAQTRRKASEPWPGAYTLQMSLAHSDGETLSSIVRGELPCTFNIFAFPRIFQGLVQRYLVYIITLQGQGELLNCSVH